MKILYLTVSFVCLLPILCEGFVIPKIDYDYYDELIKTGVDFEDKDKILTTSTTKSPIFTSIRSSTNENSYSKLIFITYFYNIF